MERDGGQVGRGREMGERKEMRERKGGRRERWEEGWTRDGHRVTKLVMAHSVGPGESS